MRRTTRPDPLSRALARRVVLLREHVKYCAPCATLLAEYSTLANAAGNSAALHDLVARFNRCYPKH